MTRRKTHYEVLAVDREASSVDIASAFRDRMAELKEKDASPEELADLRDAYQTLANPAARDDYDETLPQPRSARATRPARAAPTPRAEDGAEAPGFLHSRAAVIGIPVAVVIVAIVGYRLSRKPPPPPLPRVVAVTQLDTAPRAPQATEADESESEARPAGAPAIPAAAGAPLSPEQLFGLLAPSIVRVLVSDGRGTPLAQGSGVVIGAGRVITNCHVVKDGAGIVVKPSVGASIPATVAVADEELDLCTLDVPRLDAPAPAVGSVANVRPGQRVYAIGAPLGLELTISEGIVSALREASNGTVIQTTAPVSPGSSGGGLFAADGQLVGIVTFQHRYGQNLNFALPADWIGEMRKRNASAARSVAGSQAAADPTPAELIVGRWHCFGSLSGRNGEYEYRDDGTLRIQSAEGRNLQVPYRIAGRSVQYAVQGETFALEIESISGTRMVQVVGGGQRLACERS